MDIQIYARGLVACSACAPEDATREAIEREVNIINPTGISSQWKISTDEKFASGEPMPNKCETARNKLHYLLTC